LNPSGSALAYSTFLGGSSDDTGTSIALDTAGNAFVTGITQSTNFPTTPGAPIPRLRSADDAFVAKIGPAAAPVCRLSSVSSSSTHINAQDTNSGLNRIQVTESVNASISIPVFTAGTRNAVVVTANKVDLSRTATVGLRVTNVAGQFTDCDPALVSIGRTAGESPVQVVRHLSQGESQVTIVNGSPGLERLVLLVNGHRFEADDLHDGETRAVDVSAAMRKGERNTILLVGHGPRDSSATVLVSDS
jgi:hypothetical protein